MSLRPSEKELFLKLFNRDGYVLDFGKQAFDDFTFESIGIRLCEQYGLSRGRSLKEFIYEQSISEDKKLRLLLDLLDYYEANPCFLKDAEDYKRIYEKCREYANRESQGFTFVPSLVRDFQNDISSDYIDSQIQLISSSIETNPTVAIGKCKELIETVCKYILEQSGQPVNQNLDFPKLVKETMKQLKVMPEDIKESAPKSGTIKTLLNNLASISNNMAELRNYYGDGHGKTPSYVGLQPRHAKLAFGASSTLVIFLWETFKLKRKGDANE